MSSKKNNNGGIGCFGVIVVLFLISVALTIYSYCWIPAIFALIYCIKSKKFQNHRKRNVTICSIVIATSLITFGFLNQPDPAALEVNWDKHEFAVGETTTVEIAISPENKKIKDLQLSSENLAKLDYTDNKATVTFTQPGTASMFFTANDSINSNPVDITVIDKEAEQKKIEEEEKKKAEQEAEEERLKAEQEAAKKAEEERLKVEEEARIKAEQETTAQAEQETISQQQQEETVWIPQSGSKYHSNSSCSGMNNPTEVTLSEAQSRGYEPCKKCH